jgi:hypothetical protein
MMMEAKKVEVKTVDFDVEKTDALLNLASVLTGFPKYTNIQDATHRQLSKIEQVLEEQLKTIRDQEMKEKAEATAKEIKEKADLAAKEAREAYEAKIPPLPPTSETAGAKK